MRFEIMEHEKHDSRWARWHDGTMGDRPTFTSSPGSSDRSARKEYQRANQLAAGPQNAYYKAELITPPRSAGVRG
jgi:hypothetical protein